MTKVKFIHTADLHLDTPFKGLTNWNSELAKRLKNATLGSLKKIVDLGIQKNVDFLVISGDIFDSENQSLAAQLNFVEEIQRLAEKGIPAYFICGNHDPLSSWLEDLQMPENVFRFNASEVENMTFRKNGEPVADIHGISFGDKTVSKNLARSYKVNDQPSPVNIALLHGTVGTPGPHENYAPFKVEDIAGKGFDYWALGHIHKRQVVRQKHPAVIYPGNPQGRDFGEKGAKGCYMVEIDQNKTPVISFVPVQQIRFEELEIDLTGEDTINVLPGKIQESITGLNDYEQNTSYIIRISLTGSTPLHSRFNNPGEMEQVLEFLNEGQLKQTHFTWIDSIEVNTRPVIDIDEIRKSSDFPGEILNAIEQYESDPQKIKDWIESVDKEFTGQAKREIEGLSEDDHRQIIEKAKWMLLDKLRKEQE
jgi:DNA repair exonuclease SbcCD nuclease subunit